MAQFVNVKLPRTALTSMIVYPHSEGETKFKLQSERRMCMVDTEANTLTYSKSGRQFSNFICLMSIRGSKTIECPEELMTQIQALATTGSIVTL